MIKLSLRQSVLWLAMVQALHAPADAGGALWARIAQNVKKPPLRVNVIDFELSDFNVSIHMGPLESPWSQKVMMHW